MLDIKNECYIRLSSDEKKLYTLFEQKDYISSLMLLNRIKKRKHFNCIRFLSLIEAGCYIEQAELEKALCIIEKWYPYENNDSIDNNMMLLSSVLYEKIGFGSLARKFQFGYELSITAETERLSVYDRFYLPLKKMLCGEHKDTLDIMQKAVKELISINRMTEAAVLLSSIQHLGNAIDEEIKYIMKRYPELATFYYDMGKYENNLCFIKTHDDFTDLTISFLEECCRKAGYKTSVFNDVKSCFNNDHFDYPILLLMSSKFYYIHSDDSEFSKCVESFYKHYEKSDNNSLICLISGDYWLMMKYKYGYDFTDYQFDSKKTKFSIVIPVRNDGTYLPYAIKSCLNQSYHGNYEILISDNSTSGNNSVEQCVLKFEDKRVRYIKTPKDLPLGKSFEYAYMMAEGEYLLSIGSDDAILPYCLYDLNKAINENPNLSLFSWGNASYQWGDKKGHRSSLSVRCSDYNTTIMDTKALTKAYYSENVYFGFLPKLYLSTCFKKNIIDEFIKQTNKFEDGISQDIYTGIMAARLCPEMLRFGYPLAISGISNMSTGLNDRKSIVSIDDLTESWKKSYRNYRYKNDCDSKARSIRNMLFCCGFYMFEYVESARVDYWFGEKMIDDAVLKKFIDLTYKGIPKQYGDLLLLTDVFTELYSMIDQPVPKISSSTKLHINLKKIINTHIVSKFPLVYQFIVNARLKRCTTEYEYKKFFYAVYGINNICEASDKVIKKQTQLKKYDV